MTASTETKPLTLPCPCCGCEDAGVSVRLDMLAEPDGSDVFSCSECEATFSRAMVRSFISRWTKVLLWLDNVPTA